MRADFDLVHLRRARAHAHVGAAGRGHAVRARAELGRDRAAARRPGAADAADARSTIELRQTIGRHASRSASTLVWVSPRFGGLMVRRAAAAHDRRGARRPRADQWLSAPREPPAMRWWGWGDPAHPPALPRARARASCARTSASASARARRWRSSACACAPSRAGARRRSPRCARSSAPSTSATDHAERVLHAAGKGYPDLVRMRAGEPDGAPDAVVYPERARAAAGAAASCARAPRWRSCRSAAAPASSAAWRRCAASTRGVLALDMGRMASVLELDAPVARR